MTLDAYEVMHNATNAATATRNTIFAVGDSISDAISTAVEDTIRDATYVATRAIDVAIDTYVKDVTQ